MTELELSILKWYSQRHREVGLSGLDTNLDVLRREFTEIGFFTYFKGSELPLRTNKSGCIPGPFIHSDQVPSGAMSLLCIRDGMVEYLEVAALDDSETANSIENFELGDEF